MGTDDESDNDENEFNLTTIPEAPEDLDIIETLQPAEKQSGKEKKFKNKKFKQGEVDNEIEVSNLTTKE